MSDVVFAIDSFQADKKNDRLMCPKDKDHGPMWAGAGAAKLLCNDSACKVEVSVPNELVRQSMKYMSR
jgi:hypothetical protein